MIMSDTIYYRADGTVSSVQRTTRTEFTRPSGAVDFDDATSEVPLSAVSEHLAGPYADLDAHNKTLEAQLAAERDQAKLGIETAQAAARGEISRRDEQIATLQAAVKELADRAGLAEAKLDTVARMLRELSPTPAQA